MSFDREEFEKDKLALIRAQADDDALQKTAHDFTVQSDRRNYSYLWNWFGVPIIQMPADIIATQEIIWENKPDIIIETGVAWGGSVVFYASLLHLIGKGKVVAVEQVLPDKNRDEIMKYPFSDRIRLIEGSSVDPAIIEIVRSHIGPDDRVMVLLDSNHTHDHVLEEMRAYGAMVTEGQFLVVSDTVVEDLPPQSHRPRPWGIGNNPKTAVEAYLKETARFVTETRIRDKLLASHSKDGYLRCVAPAAGRGP